MGIDWRQEVGDDDELLDWLSDGDVDEVEEDKVPLNTSFPTTLIVVNVPKVPAEKYEKLMSFLKKLFCTLNDEHVEGCELDMPFCADGTQTQGYFVISYRSSKVADEIKLRMHNKEFDKKHTFKVYHIDEFEALANHSEEAPAPADIELADPQDLRDWLGDEKCREMFVTRFDVGDTEIYWHNNATNQPELEYGGEREKRGGKVWCDSRVQWSPLGSYISTFHRPGIALWGGDKFTKRARLLHQDVKQIEFSPDEEYLLTWNGRHAAEKDPQSVKIWKICTQECVKTFQTPSFTPRGGEFPHFLWSPDGRYLARMTETAIHVYDAQSDFEECKDERTGKAAIKFPDGLQGFEWSPKQNIISAWIPEKDNIPARLVLLEIPSRLEIAGKNLFNVRDASMHWQPEGRYLCVKAMRMSRSKKTGSTHLEIFRCMEKNVPVETVELKDTLKSFHWEPKGHRFALLTTDENGHALKAQFFNIAEKETLHVATYECHAGISHVLWAPAGQYVVLAAIPGGDLVFAQLDEKNKLDVLHKDEHFLLTDVTWDPSSRYFVSAVTQSMSTGIRYQTESGYKCWSFQGRLLYSQQKEKLFQLLWRPHPPSLIDDKEREKVRLNLKSYSKKYDSIDDVAREESRKLQQVQRTKQTEEWTSILAKIDAYRVEKWEKTGWKTAWEKLDATSQWEVRTEEVEEDLEVKEELITDQ